MDRLIIVPLMHACRAIISIVHTVLQTVSKQPKGFQLNRELTNKHHEVEYAPSDQYIQ